VSLLELENVGKRYGRGLKECVALRDVSLELEAGELVTVWGRRRSGRSTLLRIAAGVEAPDSGVVRLDGRDLTDRGCEMLGSAIGLCRKTFSANEGQFVLQHLLVGQLARGVSPSVANDRAWEALERTGVGSTAKLTPAELDAGEIVRVAIARALALQPRLLLIDEPTIGVDLLARDDILSLLRSLVGDGIAALTTTGETTALAGARALQLSDGELHGRSTRDLAPVVPLRRISA
jgi:ABC-type multidrug transport system ATPase subunit